MGRVISCFSPNHESSKKKAAPSLSNNPESSNKPFGALILTDITDALVDIIFVHGLTGHRENTWTAEGENEPWLKSLLPTYLPTTRIITYGYDANIVNLTRVVVLRRDAVGRPIIFVAHSLGGLVCQDALLICINPSEEAQSDILSSTYGVAFLGTPHAGSDLEKFATAVANVVSLVKKLNKKLLRVLRSNSEILANIKNEFLTMVRNHQGSLKPIKLHAFVEELPVNVIGLRMVEPNSAKIAGYISDTIHANHIEMTKFKVADAGYTKVLNRLRTWIDNDGTVLPNQLMYFLGESPTKTPKRQLLLL
ncbi:hypothetical protein V491_03571 [Pseudogymnoascus sp. VKM F-3775]|nr:hypothetical protein V491_03571 [Pseudogymnoascus sp. VKM F-3775]